MWRCKKERRGEEGDSHRITEENKSIDKRVQKKIFEMKKKKEKVYKTNSLSLCSQP